MVPTIVLNIWEDVAWRFVVKIRASIFVSDPLVVLSEMAKTVALFCVFYLLNKFADSCIFQTISNRRALDRKF